MTGVHIKTRKTWTQTQGDDDVKIGVMLPEAKKLMGPRREG